jgi:hypothetical protein
MYLTNRNPNGNIKFGVGGVHGTASEKMTLTSTGDLGIGTTSPSARLDVNGNIIADHLKLGELKSVGNNSVRYFKIGYFTLPWQYADGQAIVEVLTRNGGNHTVHVNIERGSNQIDYIREFFVKGSTHAETYYLFRTSANVAELWVKSNQTYDSLQIGIRNHSSDFTPDVSSGQASAPANEASWSPDGYFFNDGNLGIGTDTPSSKLDVNGNIRIDSGNGGVGTLNVYGNNQSTGRVYVGQSDSYGGGIEYNGNGIPVTTGAGRDYITLWRRENNNDQWTARNRVTNNDWEFRGDVEAFTSSDKRFKDNIVNIENPLDKISKIGGYTYEWNEKSEKEKGKKDIGVIAQEIEEVLPELVQTRENGYKAVKYDKLVALLIEGIKEQDLRIKELENKIK